MSLPKPALILSGPVPDEFGNACFVVQVDDRRVDAFGTPDGCALREADFELMPRINAAISEFRRNAPEQMLSCLREAARLRRIAGYATELAVAVPESISVRAEVGVREIGARFTVDIAQSSVDVLVSGDGAIVDSYDPTDHPGGEVSCEHLLAARRAVLDFVLARPERAGAWGLDCELLDLLWN